LIIVFRAKDIELKVKMNIELDDYSQTEAFEETELQESSKIETFEVTLDLDGERLDKVLASSLKDISRSRLKTLIEDGLVKVNGVTVDKPKEKMSFGDEVSVEIKPRLEDMDFIATPMDIDVVYEDDDILVINKPAGLVVHPPAIGTTRS
jgi:23S rRNA pseudouridine1911/1915/1917 synthase